jgi:hypothetical protein|tara:strand:- start:159 stop:446 length:288 start_codon:yes stop_codon:yes gene_type:complete
VRLSDAGADGAHEECGEGGAGGATPRLAAEAERRKGKSQQLDLCAAARADRGAEDAQHGREQCGAERAADFAGRRVEQRRHQVCRENLRRIVVEP